MLRKGLLALSYTKKKDEILDFIDELESGELEEKCSLADLKRINQFIALLAKEGILPDDSDEEIALEEDIEDLLNREENPFEYAFNFGNYKEYLIVPAVFNDNCNYDVILCKSCFKKKWKKTKKFIKKHKKIIIIGAAVVVAATVVVVAVAATSSAGSAVAAGAAAGSAASSNSGSKNANSNSRGQSKAKSKKEPSSISSIPKDPPPTAADVNEAPLMKEAINEHISSFKEFLIT